MLHVCRSRLNCATGKRREEGGKQTRICLRAKASAFRFKSLLSPRLRSLKVLAHTPSGVGMAPTISFGKGSTELPLPTAPAPALGLRMILFVPSHAVYNKLNSRQSLPPSSNKHPAALNLRRRSSSGAASTSSSSSSAAAWRRRLMTRRSGRPSWSCA
nr:hypothetical protein CFP56_19334 [Quercus suber]